MNSAFARWRASFYTGLAIVLPAVISIGILKWLFGTVANITDPLLFFLPRALTHQPEGPMYWWWSLFALLLAVMLLSLIGRMARNYIGRKLIETVDLALLQVPVLNKIYPAIKQVNEAFTSSNKTSFKQVVLVEFPQHGIYSLGFLTGSQPPEVQRKLQEPLVSVFVPTTPNPTGGFVLLVPECQVTRLEMPVADGLKFILSLGSVAPEFAANVHPTEASLEARPLQSREIPPAVVLSMPAESQPGQR
jgi:uncharacterized membrane protein